MTISIHDLKIMAMERPTERFLKGTGVLKLINAIEDLKRARPTPLDTERDIAAQLAGMVERLVAAIRVSVSPDAAAWAIAAEADAYLRRMGWSEKGDS
jgi:hypothetical protein